LHSSKNEKRKITVLFFHHPKQVESFGSSAALLPKHCQCSSKQFYLKLCAKKLSFLYQRGMGVLGRAPRLIYRFEYRVISVKKRVIKKN
jgi:hypothetical protein